MFSVVPGVADSDVSSVSESDLESQGQSENESCEHSSEENSSKLKDVKLNILSTEPAAEAESESESCAPPSGITDQNWQKFQLLQKRRNETRWMKGGTSDVGYKNKRRRRRKRKGGKQHEEDSQVSPTDDTQTDAPNEASTSKQVEHWNTLTKYFNVNDHMKGVDQGKYAPKSGMEKKLDEAVTKGNFDKAEEISDGLAQRDLACQIAKAANARDYMAWKQEQEERREANRKKRRKLAWGFEAKERWQMKGNM